MSLPYRKVLEHYDRARAFGFKGSLPEWAQNANTATESDMFSEGLRDGPWTRFSTRADIALEPFAAATTGPFGEAVGAAFGHPAAGRAVGMGLPRGILQTAPLLIPGAGEGYGLALAAGATGALFGSQTYADTGSAKAATLSGVTAGALPYVGKFAGALGARAFGAGREAGTLTTEGAGAGLGTEGTQWSGTIPTTMGQRAGQFAGSQLGQAGLNEFSGYEQHKALSPDEPYNFLSPEFLLSQLPFTVVDAVHAVTAPKVTQGQVKTWIKPLEKTMKPEVPEYQSKVTADARQMQTLQEALAKHATIAQNPESTKADVEASTAIVLKAFETPQVVEKLKKQASDPIRDMVANPELPTQRENVVPTKPLENSPMLDLPVQEKPGGFMVKDKVSTMLNNKALMTEGKSEGDLMRDFEFRHQELTKQIEELKTRAFIPLTDPVSVIQDVGGPEVLAKVKETHPVKGAESTDVVESARQKDVGQKIEEALVHKEVVKKSMQLEKVGAEYKGQKPANRGRGLLDEKGAYRKFGSESSAKKFLDNYRRENPTDKTNWNLTSRKYKSVGGRRLYYFTERHGVMTSMDAPRTESGVSLHEMLGEEPIDVTSKQKETDKTVSLVEPTKEELLQDFSHEPLDEEEGHKGIIEVGQDMSNPQVTATELRARAALVDGGLILARETGLDPLDTNRILTALSEGKFLDLRDEDPETLAIVAKGLQALSNPKANFLHGSRVPQTEEGWQVTEEMGLLHPTQGLRNAITWFVQNAPDGLRHMADLAEGLLRATNPDAVLFAHPEHPEWDASMGDRFSVEHGIKPKLNMADLPVDRADAIDWSMRLMHEYAHNTTKEMTAKDGSGGFVRMDAPAVELRKSLTEVLDLVGKSELLPKGVREVIARARKEGHYEKYVGEQGKANLEDFAREFAERVRKRMESVKKSDYQKGDQLYTPTGERVLFLRDDVTNKQGDSQARVQQISNKDEYSVSHKWLSLDPPNRYDALAFSKERYGKDTEGFKKRALERGFSEDEIAATDLKLEDVLKGQTSSSDYVPAIRVGKEVVRGNMGETHQDILNRFLTEHPDDAEALVNFDTPENPNFFMRGEEQVSREELKKRLEVSDSQGLRKLQSESKPKAGPARWSSSEMLADWKRTAGADAIKHREIIYGALNEDELVAQMFSSPEMVDLLARTRYKKGLPQTVLQFFSKAWNRIFGKGDVVSDTALGELLQRMDKYLNVGLPDGYDAHSYMRDTLLSWGTTSGEMASRMKTLDKTYATGGLQASIEGLERGAQAGLLPESCKFVETPLAIRTALLLGDRGDVFKSTMDLKLGELSSANAVWHRASQDIALAQQVLHAVKAGEVPGHVPLGAEEALAHSSAKLFKMREALDKQARYVQQAMDLGNFTTEGANTLISDVLQGRTLPGLPGSPNPADADATNLAQSELGIAERRAEYAEKRLAGEGEFSGFWNQATRWIAGQQFMARIHPAFRDWKNHLSKTQEDSHERANKLIMAKTFDPKLGKHTLEREKALAWVAQTPLAIETVSNIKRWQNEQHAKGETEELTHSYPQSQLRRHLTEARKGRPSDRQSVLDVIESLQTEHGTLTHDILPEHFGEYNRVSTARLITGMSPGMLPDQGTRFSQQLYEGLVMLSDPAQSQQGIASLQALAGLLDPTVYQTAFQHAQELLSNTKGFLQVMEDNPNYGNEQRFDRWHLLMRGVAGDSYRESFKTVEAAQAAQARMEAKGYYVTDFLPKEDIKNPGSGMNEKVLSALEELDKKNIDALTNALGATNPALLEQLSPLAQRATQLRAGLDSFKPPTGIPRQFVAGRESINMLENSEEFMRRTLNWMRYRMTEAYAGLDALHPDIASNRELKNYGDRVTQNYLTPDNPLVAKAVKTTYFYKLALDLGQSLIEMTQSLGTGMQAMISETGSVGDAFERTKEAVAAVTKNRLTGKWEDGVMANMFRKFELRGNRNAGTWHEYHDTNSNSFREISLRQKNKFQQGVHIADYMGKKWSKRFTTFNDDIALWSGTKLGLEKGLEGDDLYRFAVDLKERGYLNPGKAGRAEAMWNTKTKAIPQLITSLQGYTTGWFSQMISDYKVGFAKVGPQGYSEAQKSAARKAFLYGFAAQAVFAGALGLPGVGQGMALMEQATGVDVKGWLKKNLSSLFDEDGDSGGLLTSLAMRGLASGVAPFDPSGRMSLSVPFVGVDSYKGFSLANLAGAPATTADDLVHGLLASARGDRQAMEKLLPNALKRPFQIWQDEGDIRDNRGGLLYEMSPVERAFMAVGLTPSRVQGARDTAVATEKLQRAQALEKEAFMDGLAELTRKGELPSVHQKLIEYQSANPGTDMNGLVHSISQRVNAQKFPYDPRLSLAPGTDLRGLSPSLAPSLAARQASAEQTVQALGGRSHRPSRGQPQAAQLDALQQASPWEGISEIRQGLRHARPHPLDFLQGTPFGNQ